MIINTICVWVWVRHSWCNVGGRTQCVELIGEQSAEIIMIKDSTTVH